MRRHGIGTFGERACASVGSARFGSHSRKIIGTAMIAAAT